jgi:hypothetical protein
MAVEELLQDPNAPETLKQQLLDSMTDRYAKLCYEAYRTTGSYASGTSASQVQSAVKSNGTEDAPDKAPENRAPDPFKEGGDEAQEKHQKAPAVIPASSIDTARLPLNLEQAVAPSVRGSKAPKTLTRYNDCPIEPDLPDFREGEDHTFCAWCHQVIDRSVLHASRNEWSDEGRRHYRRDLQPYVCVAEDCREVRPSFASSREWFIHMESNHTDSWSSKVHNRLAWICTARHENNSVYAFSFEDDLLNHIRVHQCKTWVCTGGHKTNSTYSFFSRDELLRHIVNHQCNGDNDLGGSDLGHPECLAQSTRQASSCPLCLFAMEEQPLNDRNAANDTNDGDTITSWVMGSHIAGHLHHLMTVSLKIMSTMQVWQDEGEGDTQSQLSGQSTNFSDPDEEAMKKRLEDLPESVQGSIYWSDSYEEVVSEPETQEDFDSIAGSMASQTSTYRNQGRWEEAEEPEMQVSEAGKKVLGGDLQAASAQGQIEVVKLLLRNGADVNAQGGDYPNALQAASAAGHDNIVRILLDNDADVNIEGGEHGNALQAASAGGHDKIVQMLLDMGADVNAQGGKYGNALQAASAEGHDNIVQMLLGAGANVNAESGEFGSALQAATASGYDKVAQMLLDRGADVNAQADSMATR